MKTTVILVFASVLAAGCVNIQKPGTLPSKETRYGPSPAVTWLALQDFLRNGQYEKAYALFSPGWKRLYAPDAAAFRKRADADTHLIVPGRIVGKPRVTGRYAALAVEYDGGHRNIYFTCDEPGGRWFIAPEPEYIAFLQLGDRRTPRSTLGSFARFIAAHRYKAAYRLLAVEELMLRGINSTVFRAALVPRFQWLFRPRPASESWQVITDKRGDGCAVLVVDFHDKDARAIPFCLVEKLGRWYLAIEPVGKAAALLPYLKTLGKHHGEKPEKKDGAHGNP